MPSLVVAVFKGDFTDEDDDFPTAIKVGVQAEVEATTADRSRDARRNDKDDEDSDNVCL
jgi:hypothetical protein